MSETKLSRPPFYLPLAQYLFDIVWFFLCAWTPKPFNPVRLLVLRLFGAKIKGNPFVHSSARITHPWNLTLFPHAALGDRAHAYALGKIELRSGCTVAQEVYLCTGTHDFHDAALPLITAPIIIGDNSFIGARAVVLAGVKIGAHSIVGACSVVTKDVPENVTVAGNPARVL